MIQPDPNNPYGNQSQQPQNGQVQNPNGVGTTGNTGVAGPWASGAAMGPGQAVAKPAAPTGNFDLEAVRKAWAHGGKGHTQQVNPEDLQNFMRDNQNILGGATLQGEKLFHNGKFIADMIGNFKSGDPNQMTRLFLDGIGSNGKPRGKTPTGKGPLKIVDSGHGNDKYPPGHPLYKAPTGKGPASGPGTGSIGPRPGERNALYDMLMARAKQGLNVNPNDPAIRAQADAFSAQQTRAQRNDLANLAEGAGPNANLRGETRMAAERAGQASGQFESQLIGREIAARRDEIQSALTQMQGQLTHEQTLALQNELARLNDATQRRGQDINNSQFGRDLDYRNRALNQNDAQFRDRLGFDYADRSNYWDSLYRGF